MVKSSTDSLFNDKNLAKEKVESFEKTNGKNLKDFSLKEIIVMTHSDLKERIHETNAKLEKHIEAGENCFNRVEKTTHQHEINMQKITDTLKHITEIMPEKGFCEMVKKTLYAPDGTDKIEVMWNDRRWKNKFFKVLIFLVSAISITDIILKFI